MPHSRLCGIVTYLASRFEPGVWEVTYWSSEEELNREEDEENG